MLLLRKIIIVFTSELRLRKQACCKRLSGPSESLFAELKVIWFPSPNVLVKPGSCPRGLQAYWIIKIEVVETNSSPLIINIQCNYLVCFLEWIPLIFWRVEYWKWHWVHVVHRNDKGPPQHSLKVHGKIPFFSIPNKWVTF